MQVMCPEDGMKTPQSVVNFFLQNYLKTIKLMNELINLTANLNGKAYTPLGLQYSPP